jgi:methionine synthase II (cobalamin-independent)
VTLPARTSVLTEHAVPATGVGSMPGEDPREACRMIFDLLPDFPHLPELPDRGPGADMIGRTGALLTGLHIDLQPAGWRVVPRAGLDERRARDMLARDLDALEEIGEGYAGPVKVQAVGPWTLAAELELSRGDRMLRDAGAVRDLAESLTDAVAGHLAEVRRRLPSAGPFFVQLDEPSLPVVLLGRVRTASGFGAFPAVDRQLAIERLLTVTEGVRGGSRGNAPDVRVGVHCCAAGPPIELMAAAGADFLSVDLSVLTWRDDDPIGTVVEDGVALLLGVVPPIGDAAPSRPGSGGKVLSELDRTVKPVQALWGRLGFTTERLREVVGVTPGCGLAGAGRGRARAVLERCHDAGRALAEEG